MNPPKQSSLSLYTSLSKTNDNDQMSIEKDSLTESKTDNTEPTVSDVQTNILESKKTNVSSSEIDSALLSAAKAKDSDGTSLNPLKQNPLSLDTSLAKTNDNIQMSIEKDSLT